MSARARAPRWILTSLLALLAAACAPDVDGGYAAEAPLGLPSFQAEADWLPADWLLGPALGLHVDGRDHVWISFRERGGHLDQREDQNMPDVPCCLPAPLLMEVDPDGNVVQAWRDRTEVPDWPAMAHGVYVDPMDHVWVSARDQHQVLKFTRDGRHLFTIGEAGVTGGSDDLTRLGRPSNVWVDPETNEVYVADGYGNRRIIVFDAEAGAYRRHWGAYGDPPQDAYRYDREAAGGAPSRQFATAHGIIGSRDGLIYLADRGNRRIQVFRKDGTFVMERVVAPGMDLVFSPDPAQTYLYLADGDNHTIFVLRRSDLEVVAELGGFGDAPGQVQRPHAIGIDSRGNLYTAEQADQTDGRRMQKFALTGYGQP